MARHPNLGMLPVTGRRLFAHIACTFLLLFSQQLGITHAISHLSSYVTSNSPQEEQLPSEMQCAQCFAFASIGSGLTGALPSPLQLSATTETSVGAWLIKPFAADYRSFDSRAPPVRL
jgi:hypothetical protein